MSDSDKSLTLQIKTVADLAGAKAAEAALERQIAKTKALGKNTDDLDARLTTVKKAIEQYSKASKESSDDLNDLSDATRRYIQELKQAEQEEANAVGTRKESHEILASLGEIAPGIAELLRVAFMGVTGAIVLISKTIGEMLDQIKELGASATPEFETLTKAVEDQKKAMEDAELAANTYDRTFQRLAKSTESVQAASAAYIAKLKEQSSAQQSVMEKALARDNASLEAAEKLGLITHAQYIAKKLALDEEYAAKRIAIENRMQAQLVIEKYRERANTYIEAETAQAQIPAKREAAKKAAGVAAFRASAEEKDKADLEKSEDAIKKLEEEWLDLQGVHPFQSELLLRQQREENQTQQENERATAERLRAKIKQDGEQSFKARDQKNTADESLDETQGKFSKAVERLKQLDAELPNDAASMKLDISTRNQGAAFDTEASERKAAGEGFTKQPRQLQPWEPGAQQQYNVARYGADALGGAGIDASKYPAEVRSAVEDYKTHLQTLTNSLVAGFKESSKHIIETRAELEKDRRDIANKLHLISRRLADSYN